MEHVELPGEIRCGKSTAPIRKIISIANDVLQTTNPASLQAWRQDLFANPRGRRGSARRGVFYAESGAAGSRFANVNALTREKLSHPGNSATFYSVLVEVESTNSAA
jgi:hypothetical protein